MTRLRLTKKTEKVRQIEKETEIDRERNRGTIRITQEQRDRNTERQRDRETER